MVKEYISKLCRLLLCVDMIMFYLIGFFKSDGFFLFWDDGNGFIDNFEFYFFREFLDDVKNCLVRCLFIVVDYSYFGVMVNKIKSRMECYFGFYCNFVVIFLILWN